MEDGTEGEEEAPEPPEAPEAERPAAADQMPRWVPRAVAVLMLGVAGLFVVYWAFLQLRGLLTLLLISLFLSFAIEPAVNWLERQGIRRGAGTGLVFLGVFLSIVGFLVAMGSLLVDQANNLVDEAPGYIEDIEEWVESNFDVEVDAEELVQEFQEGGAARDLATGLADDLVEVGRQVVTVIFQALTVILFTFYLVADGPRLRRTVCSVLPERRQREVLRAWNLAIDKTGGYIYSRALLAFVAFLSHWLAFIIIDVPFPLPLALWVGVISQFIPTVGTYIAGIVPVVIAVLDRPVSALWVLGFIVVYQQFENYLLLPRITAQHLDMHPAVAFGAVIAGAGLLGASGAILALPAGATLQAFVSTYLNRHEVVESRLTHPRPVRPSLRSRLMGRRRRAAG
ncbi:MAG: AI-2E family transporter [Actinomycetota bacterium]